MFRVRFQVIKQSHGPLLSANASKKLGLIKFCKSVTIKMKSEKKLPKDLVEKAEEIVKKHRIVFEGYGKLPGKARIEVDPEVKPTHQRPRRFPTSKRKVLKESLDDLESHDIIGKQEEPTE